MNSVIQQKADEKVIPDEAKKSEEQKDKKKHKGSKADVLE